jgi:hypothetical protein
MKNSENILNLNPKLAVADISIDKQSPDYFSSDLNTQWGRAGSIKSLSPNDVGNVEIANKNINNSESIYLLPGQYLPIEKVDSGFVDSGFVVSDYRQGGLFVEDLDNTKIASFPNENQTTFKASSQIPYLPVETSAKNSNSLQQVSTSSPQALLGDLTA